jgi:methyltransferase (TIGR00027 family)
MPEECDGTAVLVALWRAAHLVVDDPPPVLEDRLGLEMVAPAGDFLADPINEERFCRRFRGTMVGRGRFVEDLVADHAGRGIHQYVILGAGLDTFALRRPYPPADLKVFEIDEPGTQAWKRRRIAELGWDLPEHLSFVPVDFETGESWVKALMSAGFDTEAAAVVSCMGVTVYLTQPAVVSLLQEVAALAPGTVFVCAFYPPEEFVEPEERAAINQVKVVAADRGCPWLTYYTAEEFTALARDCGFSQASVVSAGDVERRYFAGRSDGLRPSTVEGYLVATV